MPLSDEREQAQSPERMNDYAVFRFIDVERTSEFVMRFCEALGDHGCARSLDRFGDMELWIGPHGVEMTRQAGGSALYASRGAVRAFEELALERSQVGWVSEEMMPDGRRLVFRYEPDDRGAVS